jgi:hypothetical protein
MVYAVVERQKADSSASQRNDKKSGLHKFGTRASKGYRQDIFCRATSTSNQEIVFRSEYLIHRIAAMLKIDKDCYQRQHWQ